MFDQQLTIEVSDKVWGSAQAQAELADADQKVLAAGHGSLAMLDDPRRRYRRVRASGRALAVRGQDRYGVFTIDISPMGIGFYSPVPFLPREQITLCFEPAEQLALEISRCVRTEGTTYSCGGRFASGPLSPSEYHNFLTALR